MSKSISQQAHEIVNKRSQEKEREYGPFSEGMERAAQIYSGMTGKEATAEDMFKAMVALKLSRESYNHKTDNLLDAIAYLQGLENYEREKGPKQFGLKLGDLSFPGQKNQ